MNSHEGQPTGLGTEDDYESTVLDFLNREIASDQQAQKPDQQSDDVDALVSDLLQQVITEADQSENGDKPLYDEDELFVGLAAGAQRPADTAKDASVPSQPDPTGSKEIALPEAEPAVDNPEPLSEPATAHPTAPPLFETTGVASGRRFPVKIAAALAVLLLILGAGTYYFLGKSGKIEGSRAPAAQVAQSEIPASPVSSQPVSTTAAKQEKPAPIVHTAAARVVKTAPAAPVSPPELPTPKQPAVKPSAPVAHQKSEPEPAPAKTANEGKVAAPQPAPVIPAPEQTQPVIEKPSPQPAAETSSSVTPERKPAPAQPVTNAAKEPPAPSQTPAPAPPVVSGNLIPSVPISQSSPVYPALALRTRASGQVVLDLQIDAAGKVVKAKPVSGPSLFYNAAITAAMQWRYRPASVNGVNVPSQSRVTMSFNLKE
jgi:TonB family protein